MNTSPDSKAPASGSPKKRNSKKRMIRHAAIQEIILIDGLTKPTEINTKLEERGIIVDRHTVGEDIQYMMYDNEFWLQAMTKSVWVAECRKQYIETNQEIQRLKEFSDHLINEEMGDGETVKEFEWATNPFTPDKDPSNYLKFENIRTKAYAAFMKRYSHGLEVAQLQNAITKKREWMHQFIKDLPLYWKLKQLVNWVDTNKPKNQSIIAPIPEMEVEQIVNK